MDSHYFILSFVLFGTFIPTICNAQQRVLLIAGRETVVKIDLDSRNVSVISNISDEKTVLGLGFDKSTGYFYAAQIGEEQIWRAKINGSEKETVVHMHRGTPDDVAVDSVVGNIYWVDSTKQVIEVYNANGKYRRVLVSGLDKPRAICVDPVNGLMFWNDWGEYPSITRAYLDGSHPETIVDDDITWPNGLVNDPVNKKVYWGDAKSKKLEVADYDGKNRRVLLMTGDGHIYAMTMLGNYIYWTDWITHHVERVNKFTGLERSIVYTNVNGVNGLVGMDTARTLNDTNRCAVRNGGCPQFCFYRPPPLGHICANNEGEGVGTETMLLVAHRTGGISQVFPALPHCRSKTIPFNSTFQSAIAVDFHAKSGFIYWSHDDGFILRAKLDGSDQKLMTEGDRSAFDGLAIDWIANNLYWTNTDSESIGVLQIYSEFQKDIVTEGLDEPRAIALDPAAGHIYWTDWGRTPKIERAFLDGSTRKVIVQNDIQWPNGLALDLTEKKMYWGDALVDRIERCDLDGGNRKVLTSEVRHVFGLTLLGDNIYWTDWQTRSIERMNKHTGLNRTVVCHQKTDLMGLKGVDKETTQPGNNSCGTMNGNCSHLCLYRPPPLDRVCACPKELNLLPDGVNCGKNYGRLILALKSEIRIVGLDPSSQEIKSIKGLGEVTAVDCHYKNNSVYWIDAEKQQINSVHLDDRVVRTVIGSDLNKPTHLAVDWVAGNLYWTDTGRGVLEVSRLNGLSRKILIKDDFNDLQTFVLDPIRRYMYWAQDDMLIQAHLDGSNRRVFVSNFGRVTDMTFDFEDGRLFWIDEYEKTIKSVDMNGQYVTIVTEDLMKAPTTLTLYNEYLYWSTDDQIVQGNKRINGSGGDVIDVTVDGEVIDLVSMHPGRYPVPKKHACPRESYNKCEHLCFARPVNTTMKPLANCGCPTHYTLKIDGRTCSPPTEYMLVSTNEAFYRVVIESSENKTDFTSVKLPHRSMRNVRSLAYDTNENFVYWTQGKKGIAKRAPHNASHARVITTGAVKSLILADDIDIDPYTRTFYWTQRKNKVINVNRIDIGGSPAETIMTSPKKFRPKSIALYAERGIMLFTNMLRQPRIERARMDGSGHTVILKTNLGYPHSLVIDKRDVRLYWADASLNRIEASDLDGRNRVMVAESSVNNFGVLTVQGQFLCWLNKEMNEIEGLKTEDFSQRVNFGGLGSGKMDSFVAVSHLESMSWHPCYHDNGGCSHICFLAEKKAQCSCPIGLRLSRDNKTCDSDQSCKSNEFKCTGGDIRCIPLIWRCDHYPECEDDSDEKGCEYCNANEFTCLDGMCLNKELVCDGKKHCHDGSDEFNCRFIYFNVTNTEDTHTNIRISINTSGSNNKSGSNNDTCCDNNWNSAFEINNGTVNNGDGNNENNTIDANTNVINNDNDTNVTDMSGNSNVNASDTGNDINVNASDTGNDINVNASDTGNDINVNASDTGNDINVNASDTGNDINVNASDTGNDINVNASDTGNDINVNASDTGNDINVNASDTGNDINVNASDTGNDINVNASDTGNDINVNASDTGNDINVNASDTGNDINVNTSREVYDINVNASREVYDISFNDSEVENNTNINASNIGNNTNINSSNNNYIINNNISNTTSFSGGNSNTSFTRSVNGRNDVNFNTSYVNKRNPVNEKRYNTSSETNQDIKDCTICNQNTTYESIMHHYCNAEIAMKATIKNFEKDGGNLQLNLRRKKELYKPRNSPNEKEILRSTVIIRGGSSCSCEYTRRRRTRYLLIGHKRGGNIVVTYGIPMRFSDSGFRKAMKKITNWFSAVFGCLPFQNRKE